MPAAAIIVIIIPPKILTCVEPGNNIPKTAVNKGKLNANAILLIFKEAIKAYSGDGCGILFYECGGETISKIVSENPSVINVFIGSEGGFEKEEAELAHDNGIALATLGKRILRCETAPVAALSSI